MMGNLVTPSSSLGKEVLRVRYQPSRQAEIVKVLQEFCRGSFQGLRGESLKGGLGIIL